MCNSQFCWDLLANIVGGVVAAGLIGLGVCIRDRRKRCILEQLIEIMGKAIIHRNNGETKKFTDVDEWIQQAEKIEDEAIAKAKKLSPFAGALVEWLDRTEPQVKPYKESRYVAILGTVIERIRGLLERNS